MAKEYIAKESTSQAILTKATETDTAVDGIVGKVGETNDSSGSATSGGIFAKLNKVITDTTSLLTRLTTARAASLDRIGSNGDSGNDTLFGVLSQGTNIEPDVKEFLNSTVGTSGFQSLDKIIKEGSVKKLVPSPTLFFETTAEVKEGTDKLTISNVTFKQISNPSKVKLQFTFDFNHAADKSYSFDVKLNGVTKENIQFIAGSTDYPDGIVRDVVIDNISNENTISLYKNYAWGDCLVYFKVFASAVDTNTPYAE